MPEGDRYIGCSEVAERRLIKQTVSEDFFYSKPGADGCATPDDAITKKESNLPALLSGV